MRRPRAKTIHLCIFTLHISVFQIKNLFTYQLQILLFLFVNLRNWLIGIFKLNIYSKFEFPLYSAKNLDISIIFDYFIYLPYIKRKLSLNLVYDLQKKYDLSWSSISLLFLPFYFPLVFTILFTHFYSQICQSHYNCFVLHMIYFQRENEQKFSDKHEEYLYSFLVTSLQ